MENPKDFNLTFSGCAFLGVYHIGVMSCLKENAVDFLNRVNCYGGASAGSFAAVGLAMDLSISEVAEPVIRLTNRAKSLSFGPLHPSFQLVRALRTAFRKILPENAHEIASGKLHISMTSVPDLTNVIVSEFFSKEDLIEALVASSHVPFYSGIFPSIFRGKYYIDGGISDNLPQHFAEGETITVSPFSGESDICPQDKSSNNDIHIELRNTSLQLTLQNFYRFSRALFPPNQDVLANICRQGYWDALRFLQEHYPTLLTKESLRSTPSMPTLDLLQTNTSSICFHGTCCTSRTLISIHSPSEAGDVRDGGEVSVCTDMEEGESKLFKVLYEAFNSTTERELWSCYVIRRSLYAVKILSKPCSVTIHQILVLLKRCLVSLATMDKTGNKLIDDLLSMISMIVQTYRDEHQVQSWRGSPSRLAISDKAHSGKSKTRLW
ncbi:patatin-like phospholipase domain-containing protein 4 [Montipora capricornis]|uniref:patatin-like phospholipase domain-containing protein 4 n=1 Tax=Montipora capricornis TaxID=246305 RepID=UPI0035F1E3BD